MPVGPQPVPPRRARPAALIFVVTVLLTLAVLGTGAILFFFDPTKHGFYPICLFHALTGWNCPGCGGTRAAYQLLHGHLLRALHDNALFVFALTTLVIWGAWQGGRRMRHLPVTFNVPVWVWWVLLIFTALFTVLRNLPAFAWLSP